MSSVTSREGILNLHSLLHDQISSTQYTDMIEYAWKNTDPAFNTSELTNSPQKMVNDIQFNFDQAGKCQKANCTEHAFVKCLHCGKLLCLKHFLKRTCFHQSQNPTRSKRSITTLEGKENRLKELDSQFWKFPSSSTSATTLAVRID